MSQIPESPITTLNKPVGTGSDAFAPANPTDGRGPYEFRSKWPSEAWAGQRNEGIYLASLWLVGVGGIFALLRWTSVATTPSIATSMALGFCAGLLGGTTFDVKWWYHSIAKGLWHLDRKAWRLAVPWVAAIVSMFVQVLFRSDLLGFLNPAALDKIHNILAFGFLVGYFSDSAIAKMAEIAESMFGTSRGSRDRVGK